MTQEEHDEVMEYDKIKIAIARMIDTWDMETLIQFAVEERIDYYTGNNVYEEEVEQLLEEWG
tara:strand:- start:906 stop:1091 length:186 start_codon:yes stop_codon:yes gene_type:complete